MKKIIDSFIKENPNGLLLNARSTGSGKTYDAECFILEKAEEYKNKGEKIFFVTPLLKNVEAPFNELKELFKSKGKEKWFDENVIFIKSVLDSFLEGIEKIDTSKDILFESKEFKEVIAQYQLYKRNEQNIALKEMFMNQLSALERDFRKMIEEELKDFKGSATKRNHIVKKHPELLKLYPSILSSEKTVFFMSFSKFYSKNITLINRSERFIDSKLTEGALIFLDEFDSAKSWALDAEIENQTKYSKIGNVNLFHQIRNGITRNLPNSIYKYEPTKQELLLSEEEQYDVIKSKEESLKSVYSEMKNVINEVSNDIHFSEPYKVQNPDTRRKYIYSSQFYITFADDKGRCDILVNWDKEALENKIYFIPLNECEKFKDENPCAKRMTVILARIKGADRYFISGIGYLAENYCKWINSNKNHNEDERTLSDAIASILKPLGMADENIVNLVVECMTGIKKSITVEKISTSIYEKGIRYFEFLDGKGRDFETEIKEYAIVETPEQFLLNLAKKANVVGLSATCLIPSNISNFDLKYIKNKLGNDYYEPNKDDLGNMYENDMKRLEQNKSKIYVHSLIGDNVLDCIKDKFNDEKDYYSFKKKIEIYSFQQAQDGKGEFFKIRYLKMIDSIVKFIETNSQVHLAILNNNFSDAFDLYGIDFLKDFLTKIGENDIEVISLISADFEFRKNHYLKCAKEGKRIILLASFASCSAGQNLYYEKEGNRFDISSLYIENPTNILVDPTKFDIKEDNTKEMLRYFYQIESISENNEMDWRDKEFYIRKAFHHLNGERIQSDSKISPYKTETVLNAALSIVIQSAGRISRVVNKGEDITTNIYLDNTILEKIDFSILDGQAINKELQAIIDFQKNNNFDVQTISLPQNLISASNNNRYYGGWINQQLSTPWRLESMTLWQELRKWLIRNPYKDSFDNSELDYKNLYIELDDKQDNYYIRENEKSHSKVKEYEFSTSMKEKYKLVFDDMFSLIKGNKDIESKFIELGYPTSITPSKFLMLPCFYAAIYKGIVGEEIGRIVFEDNLGIKLNQIDDPSKFEKFDFMYLDNYIDFKFWDDDGYDLQIEHIERKLNDIKGKYAFIVNVYGNNSESIHCYGNVFVIPSLIDRKTFEYNSHAIQFINKKIREDE